jgi:hypothetical protein
VSTQPKLNARLLQALLRVSLLTLVGGAALIVEAAPVMAQEQAPLRLALINVSGKDGRRAYEEFEEILRSSPDIQLTRGAKLEDRLEQYDLSEKILRKGDLRERHKRDFIKLMRAENLEALMIIDVYNKKRKLQVVAIGPMGEELADVQENITRGTPSRKQVVGVLKESFGKVVPAVKAFRDRPAEEPTEERDPEIVTGQTGAGEGNEDGATLREEAARRVRDEHGLEPGANASVGAFFGRRAMDLEEVNAPNGYTLQHSSPFIGIAARLDGIFTTFGAGDSAIGGNVFVAYAPFTTVFSTMSGQPPQELASSFLRLGGELEYTKVLTSRLRLNVFGGLDRVGLTIAQNNFYTGSTYLNARLGAGVVFRFGPDAYLRAHGAALPVLSNDNSGGTFGDSPFSWGFEGGALLRFTIINDVFIQLQYTYQRFSPEFPNPKADIGVATTSVDQYHTGSLQVGMSF